MGLASFSPTWKDQLKTASFKGAEFKVSSNETTGGRKTAVHEFPDRDINMIEDLGRATRTFNFDAFLIGSRYHEKLDALLSACETPGPGTLVHPRLGEIEVQLSAPVRFRESEKEGGMASVSLNFSETQEPDIPSLEIDTYTALLDAVSDTIDAIEEVFEELFSVFGLAQNFVTDISTTINEAVVAIDQIKSNAQSALNFQKEIANLTNNLDALLQRPADLAAAFKNLFTADKSITGILENLQLQEFKSGGSNEPNNQALINMIQQMAVAGAADALQDVSFVSRPEAVDIRVRIGTAFDRLMVISVGDLYDVFYSTRAAVVQDIDTRSVNLPFIVEFKIPVSLPSLFIAYDIYENIDRAPEIVSANDVIHPGFVPGGVPLEVLSRA